MLNINIKPFSINGAWQGKRYKTSAYKQWRYEFSMLLEKDEDVQYPIMGFLEVNYKFFIRNYKRSDGENFIKTTSDALVENEIIQDDRFIKKYTVEKFMLNDLDQEHIEIEIKTWDGSHYKHDPSVNMKNIKREE